MNQENYDKLKSYYQLRDRTDRFLESVTTRYQDQIVCKPGCVDCCMAGLTVVMVEAVSMGLALGVPEELVHLQAGQEPLKKSGYCPFLTDKHHCGAYSARPLVCRTHGMPLLLPNKMSITVCEHNFKNIEPHSSAVLNTENLEAALFAANMVYCQQEGLDPMSRVAVDRIAALVDKNKKS